MVAFLIGGYVAGRMAGRLGLKHGLLVALLSVVATAALVVAGLVASVSLADGLIGVTLPQRPNVQRSLEAALSPSGVLVIILPFVGSAFGGAWGAKTGGKRP